MFAVVIPWLVLLIRQNTDVGRFKVLLTYRLRHLLFARKTEHHETKCEPDDGVSSGDTVRHVIVTNFICTCQQ